MARQFAQQQNSGFFDLSDPALFVMDILERILYTQIGNLFAICGHGIIEMPVAQSCINYIKDREVTLAA